MSNHVVKRQVVLRCPFPSAIHDQAQHIEVQTISWAKACGLVSTAHEQRRLAGGKFATLMARAYPTAHTDALQLIADWNTWTFLLDDQFDEHSTGHNPVAVERMHGYILTVLAGNQPQRDADVRMHALHQISQRLHQQRNAEWMAHFERQVRDTLAASLWEARNRQAGLIPTEHDYRYWRQFTSGVLCYFALIELAQQLILPVFVLEHPIIQQLVQAANYAICWSNDLFSLPKEMARGDVHNLVFIVQHERQISLEAASDYVAAQYDAEVARFQELRLRLPHFGSKLDWQVEHYVNGLASWMRANLDWSTASARYQQAV